MSYQYTVTERRRRTATNSYGATSNRTTLGYWVPLVLTVGAAVVGIAAWVWSERSEDDDSDAEHYAGGVPPPGYASMSGGMPPGPGPMGMQNAPQGPGMPGPPQAGGFQDGGYPPGPPPPGGWQGPPPPGARGEWESTDMYGASRSTNIHTQEQDTGLVARMSSALGINRSASPAAQSFGWAGQQVAAGFAAAGAMVGGALSGMRDGDQGEYRDHERWSEEAEQQEEEVKQGIRRRGTADEYFSGQVDIPKQAREYTRKRKTVAIVVSAVDDRGVDADLGYHASILAHLPEYIDAETTRVFVLIYAPNLRVHPLSTISQTNKPARSSQSMASSFSNISTTDAHTPAQTPGDFPGEHDQDNGGILSSVEPKPLEDVSPLFKTLYNQGQAIVEHETMILPFTSPQGHRNILKSLGPEVVYIQESLCGREGELVGDLSGWVRQIVVVIGDEGGAGGLIDTDDETARRRDKEGGTEWWMREERTGLGKRVSVVEGVKVGDDWKRRINEVD
ncbi:uncharacterized protein HMPREF1541_00498 [Cyphellophora europaea CBS 101466]|uniref:Uncharacterized protein n=1 Tax=Cyphellophora europaea (strain CBS 101466) TaxID=1220924 RepID=W2SEH6_CYPE1|nr:uncharacterized protein HMPREF1541_00498 [Cyphellophora europaea CBS 101466]ETN46314.1 hypothetical protein HMPREF1541_00498 [Cyphellophora europaea CBS 101466]